ncbi:HxHSH motif-containing lipoprotein [Metamycoplasma neophronis]|uniref:Lipoprotein n=1 Tax=Metamycoplasma neophronis TaxID=872983 RepID=A0ABY2Z027_9BACT|nr:hypothetical protein [Metamycoplasma neophronis]TPR53395.1 hypothetical protein FJR74_02685 [Metamycoplasma neophronis]
MKKSLKLVFSTFSFIPLASIAMVACQKNHDGEDKENKKFREPREKAEQNKYVMQNSQTKTIANLYNTKLTDLFNQVKDNYRNYRQVYVPLKRNWDILSNKIKKLGLEQSIDANRDALMAFYNAWLSKDTEMMKENPFAVYLYKYTLIFQDVDAVLADTNLVFENNEFLKHLEVIDKRLRGIDITLGETQSSINAIWQFLKAHIFNKDKLTQWKSLQTINIEADKNSHSHSHAIINLTYEMGLWHEALQDKKSDGMPKLETQYNEAIKHVIDNIDHIEYKNNYDDVIKVLSINGAWSSKYNLVNLVFQNEAEAIMNQIKVILKEIARSQGLEDQIDLN